MVFIPTSVQIIRSYQILILSVAPFFLGSLQAATLLKYKEAKGTQYHVYLSQNHVGSQDGFYNLPADQFVVMNHTNRSFSQISTPELISMVNMSNQVMNQLEGMSAYLPPQYRDALNSATAPKQPLSKVNAFELKKIGASQVAGYDCTGYQLVKSSKVQGEVCLASPSQLSIPQEDITSLLKAVKVTKKLLSNVPGMTERQQQQVALLQDGIPLRMKNSQGQSWILESIESSDNELSIPASYTKKPLAIPQL